MGINNLKVAEAKELLGYLNVFKLCQFL